MSLRSIREWRSLGLVLFCAGILVLSIRGIPGSPTARELNSPKWREGGPFELSPDRGRFALVYSIVEDRSLTFSQPLARFSTPDVAIRSDGRYVSLFAPGVSFLVIPGYLIGKLFGAGQIGVFTVIAVFALFNALLVRALAIRLDSSPLAASIVAVVFLFATPAFTYSVTLYQHHVSLFLLLGSIYILLQSKSLTGLLTVWLAYGAAVVVDYPNLFMMFPVAVAALLRIAFWEKYRGYLRLGIRMRAAATILVVLLPIGLLLWFNQVSYGNSLQLSGTLPTAEAIDEQGRPTRAEITKAPDLADKARGDKEKTAVGFFQTRNLLNGFYIHLISPDRGVIYFTPVILIGIVGLVLLFRSQGAVANLLAATAGLNLLLYSMWGDPWGGWAFGSRYLIPSYAVAAIGLAVVLTQWRHRVTLLLLFTLLFGYSVWVNTAGALSSSRNPPQAEILALEKISGHEEKYTFMRNIQYLDTKGSKSFVFQTVASKFVSARAYHTLLSGLIFIVGGGMVVALANRRRSDTSNLIKSL